MNTETELQWVVVNDIGNIFKECFTKKARIWGEVKNDVYDVITSLLEAERAKWLRSEIEKLEGMKKTPNYQLGGDWYGDEKYNQSLTSIITRYKEELLELEKGV